VRPADGTRTAPAERRTSTRGLTLGFLACLPLFLVYELGLFGAGADAPRNLAQVLLTRVLDLLGERADLARWLAIAALAGAGFVRLRLADAAIGRALLFVLLEGLACAIILGPILLALVAALGVDPALLDFSRRPAELSPLLERAARLLGAGAWEELFFRVGIFSLAWLIGSGLGRGLGLEGGALRSASEASAFLLSALAFAAFHLEAFTRWVGVGGEAFDARVFLWRFLAGLALALLFRWRGLGVAAWAHGSFNLALALGVGPGVLGNGP
jgi:hypothetical protein